jgi:hypothetical protein
MIIVFFISMIIFYRYKELFDKLILFLFNCLFLAKQNITHTFILYNMNKKLNKIPIYIEEKKLNTVVKHNP